ncbi:MAG: Transposase, IS4 family [uncultured Thermomicrobiales bacterium]|uniref:Transposase, IS4 family n=1 Tax=uncultured Thermomicrobiales bacterium TaxID=1645740 RepID=A0A6J4VA53_9BACT|nr:MAG: Transposase, IS4 family [uncultured Thermomicrobiales bacterium]
MRGRCHPQLSMLAFVDLDARIPAGHPLRTVKRLADRALAELSPVFDRMYAASGRPSIPPERLLKASLLIALHSVRSERAFCEELAYHLLYRWFLGMDLLDPGFDASSFTKNREWLLRHEVAQRFFDEVVFEADRLGLLSDAHFTVDGTLIEAAASLKSPRPKDGQQVTDPAPDDPGNPTVDFRGERRFNATHVSATDPEARLARKGKGKEAKLSYLGHARMENRHGLLVDFRLTQATGTAERAIVPELLDEARQRGFRPRTLGADKSYDTRDCVAAMRKRKVTPHVAQNTTGRRSAIDGRTTSWPGYRVSQRVRKRVEEIFGWLKTVGGFRRTRYRGVARTQFAGYLVAAAYNIVIVRITRLVPRPATG